MAREIGAQAAKFIFSPRPHTFYSCVYLCFPFVPMTSCSKQNLTCGFLRCHFSRGMFLVTICLLTTRDKSLTLLGSQADIVLVENRISNDIRNAFNLKFRHMKKTFAVKARLEFYLCVISWKPQKHFLIWFVSVCCSCVLSLQIRSTLFMYKINWTMMAQVW